MNKAFKEWEAKARMLGVLDDYEIRETNGLRELIHYNGNNPNVIVPPVDNIDKSAFQRSKTLKSIKLTGNVSHISDFAFAHCRYLEKLDLYNSILVRINTYLAPNSININEIILPKYLKELSPVCFRGLSKLTHIDLPKGTVIIGEESFKSTGLTSIVIPETVQFIGDKAFDMCMNLREIVILSDVLFSSSKMIRGPYKGNLTDTYNKNLLLSNCILGSNLPNLEVILVNKSVERFVRNHTLPKYKGIIKVI